MTTAELLDRLRAAYERAATAIEQDDLPAAKVSLAQAGKLAERLDSEEHASPAALWAETRRARGALLQTLENERDLTAKAIARLRRGRQIVDRLPDSVKSR